MIERCMQFAAGLTVVLGGASTLFAGTFGGDFPSAGSTVVPGFIDGDEVGFFWSVAMGHSVEEIFSNPAPSVIGIDLNMEVVTTLLDEPVEWDVLINGTVVGGFTVPAGFTGLVTVCETFAPVASIGGNYKLRIEVTNRVLPSRGSHSLAYAGFFSHDVAFVIGGDQEILVYDTNTAHQLAQTAALNISPGGTTVAAAGNFNALLNSQPWDVVVVDCPSTVPDGGWGDLIAFVNGGGRVVMAFWDWDNTVVGDPNLVPAFGGTGTTGDVVWQVPPVPPNTLTDTGASSVFAGVTMPNSDWHQHWGDDGDRFSLGAGATGLAQINGVGDPVMFMGNGGRTIASSVLDEAGAIWLFDGSGVRLWENMITQVRTDAVCPQDLDGDSMIGFSDLLLVITGWGPCPAGCLPDIDGDLMVGFSDLLLVITRWGPCP